MYVQDAGAADLEPRDASRQQIRKGVPGRAAVNGPSAAGAGGRNRVKFPVSHVGAEAELMAPRTKVTSSEIAKVLWCDLRFVAPPR